MQRFGHNSNKQESVKGKYKDAKTVEEEIESGRRLIQKMSLGQLLKRKKCVRSRDQKFKGSRVWDKKKYRKQERGGSE
jgi:hypothetical protein